MWELFEHIKAISANDADFVFSLLDPMFIKFQNNDKY